MFLGCFRVFWYLKTFKNHPLGGSGHPKHRLIMFMQCLHVWSNLELVAAKASFTQKYKYLAKPEHIITISGLLFPNTVYNTYCSAEDPVTGVHSNWTSIVATYQTARTGGCFNCGNEIPPDIFLWGGFVGARSGPQRKELGLGGFCCWNFVEMFLKINAENPRKQIHRIRTRKPSKTPRKTP